MTIRVLLFASWSDALGARSIDVEVAPDATAADVLAAVVARVPDVPLAAPAVAVNRSIVRPETRVRDRDEVAIIPPVAGG